jgi:hypothetical protein
MAVTKWSAAPDWQAVLYTKLVAGVRSTPAAAGEQHDSAVASS